jgi:hypothetical protein
VRPGDLDPYVASHLMRVGGMSVDEVDDLFNHRLGLMGLSVVATCGRAGASIGHHAVTSGTLWSPRCRTQVEAVPGSRRANPACCTYGTRARSMSQARPAHGARLLANANV